MTLGRAVPTLPSGIVVQAMRQPVPVLSGQPIMFLEPAPVSFVDSLHNTGHALPNPAIS